MLLVSHLTFLYGILFQIQLVWIGVNSLEMADLEGEDNEIDDGDSYYDGFCEPNGMQTRTISFNPNDVKFYLYNNPKSIYSREEIVIGNKETLKNLVPNKEIKILVHGILGNSSDFCDLVPARSLKNAYLQNGFQNIICVDWGKLAGPNQKIIAAGTLLSYPFYFGALKNVRTVGNRISKLIQFIIANQIVESPDSFHLLGHSLGAHVVGSTGAMVKKSTKTPIGRITGLDPAGPFTILLKEDDMLKKDSGKFVDNIHANTNFFGTIKSLGTVDFYANGGRGTDQPDCKNKTLLGDGIAALSCGHFESINYFKYTISGKVINGCKCKKTNFEFFQNPHCVIPKSSNCENHERFGEFVSKTAKGNYYIKIKLESNPKF